MNTIAKIKHLFTKLQLNRNSNLSGDALKHVLISSMYAEEQSAYLNSYETGLNEKMRNELLKEQWNILNEETAKQTLSAFLDVKYRNLFSEIYFLYQSQHPCPERVLLDQVGTKKLSQLSPLFQNLPSKKQDLIALKIIQKEDEINQYGIVAWDMGRAAFIARLCYENQWMSLTELKDYLRKCYTEMRKTIRNWEAYTKSYIIGSILWGCQNKTDFSIFAKDLLSNQKSPLLQNPL